MSYENHSPRTEGMEGGIARTVRPEVAEPTLPPDAVAPHFTGPVVVRRVAEALGTGELQINAVFFEAGVRSRPHSHSFDQIVYYVSGTGLVAVDGGEDMRVEQGEFALLPARVPHMHGATEDGPACHISLMRDVDMDFDCPIPESWRKWRE